jgi:hypothetical protein
MKDIGLGPIEGYEDIHNKEAYIDADYSDMNGVAHIYMLYVPPCQRAKGVGVRIFNDWLSTLPTTTKRVRLKAATCGGSDSLKFWKRLGFTEAFTGNIYHEIENTLVLGINGYSNPVVECISIEDDFRHWIEDSDDLLHLEKNPQISSPSIIMNKTVKGISTFS